jgi:hypothetical protein
MSRIASESMLDPRVGVVVVPMQPERVQRLEQTALEKQVLDELGVPILAGVGAVDAAARIVDVEARRGGPDVAPPPRERARADHLPRRHEGKDMVAHLVWEVTDAVAATATASAAAATAVPVGSPRCPVGRRPPPFAPLKHFIEQVPCTDNGINITTTGGETKIFANAARNQEELGMLHIDERIRDQEQELGTIPRMAGSGEEEGNLRIGGDWLNEIEGRALGLLLLLLLVHAEQRGRKTGK